MYETEERQRIIDVAREARWLDAATGTNRPHFCGQNWSGLDFSDGDWSGEEFTGAILEGANFSGCNLAGANLNKTRAKNANFRDAKLDGCEFIEADLMGACFEGADLVRAKLWDAILGGANLTDVRGLGADQLAGADLSGAKLPEDLAEFPGVKHVENLSLNAAKVFVTLLGAIAFTLITIASARDVDLILNEVSTNLPILGVRLPIIGFFAVAPSLLLILFLYLQLYLQRLWETLAKLPAIFPDGRHVDESTYPWLMNDLARDNFRNLRTRHRSLSRLQSIVTRVLGWWLTPIVLWTIWANGLRAQNSALTLEHVLLTLFALGTALWFGWLRLHTFLIHGQNRKVPFSLGGWLRIAARWVGFAVGGVVLVFWTDGVNNAKAMPGDLSSEDKDTAFWGEKVSFGLKLKRLGYSLLPSEPLARPIDDEPPSTWQRWGPHLLVKLGVQPTVNLEGTEFSKRLSSKVPASRDSDEEISAIQPSVLSDRRLRHIRARNSFAANAEWTRVDLSGASLWNADLTGANFTTCIFRGAELVYGRLKGARFNYCDVSNARFVSADLSDAVFDCGLWGTPMRACVFEFANCDLVDFGGANLTGANFRSTSLAGADLRYVTGLRPRDLTLAATLWHAELPLAWANLQDAALKGLCERIETDDAPDNLKKRVLDKWQTKKP